MNDRGWGLRRNSGECEKGFVGDRKGTPKKLCDKEFAELSADLSGAVCLKTLVLFRDC